ncbi:PREDICTED: protein phosphatase 1 regulatory subunit 21-like [Amphimedon queenslandica]|uniref:Protein phosphatase 1 regulatory subunit 21 N-terminal domain-containing protein n=1 Tax=Amphimedon queenslandica TaxID=400682 RepID=A0A1X7UT57_AMPQE|nr:PREDICTED: protein phosphatase 1 regulatory subunit 21-like [Amphimedon queenslandica]|eukprot:XP_019852640.1 PREDICTED: protein phosphatase 1 regulatory subunit 21-like [Amphimedon queenslandica]
MGSELQVKYQKLAQEYAKLRAQVDVLKQAVRTEQNAKASLEVELRTKDQALRKHAQENESLNFRNQQLSKRVSMLQDDLES